MPETSFLEPARRLADDLLRTAHVCEDGSLSWGRGSDRHRRPFADNGPFNGRCGEALLLAALFAATGDERYREAASRALLGLRRGLERTDYRDLLSRRLVLGLGGLGGLVYALVRCGETLDMPELLRRAELLATVVTPERIAQDRSFDIVWGAAGALLGLLALARTGSSSALDAAGVCASHLLEHRDVDPESGLRAWSTLRSVPSASFAHGASGIAHALLALHRETGDEAGYDAAIEAFAFERTLYRPQAANWIDSRVEPDDSRWMWSWCHGAPGIGLGRLTAIDHLRPDDEPAIAEDLRNALRGSIAAHLPGVDSVCCGYFGRIDFLLEAGRRLGNPSLIGHAHRLAHARLERAEEKGFLLNPDDDVDDHLKPGFWQGLGGIGYALLRLEDPERFPCVLAMA